MQKCRSLGALVLLVSLCFGIEGVKERQEQLEQDMKVWQEKLKGYKPPELSQEEKERLKRQVEEVKRKSKEWENRISYDGQRVVIKQEGRENKTTLAENAKLYIFMSSSVPKVVWDRYLSTIDALGIGDKAVLVLRGCIGIGGCTYIKPTLEFLASVLKEYKAQVWIDPLLFRRFSISEVPCFVFVRGDELENPELSAGLLDNLKVKGAYMKTCGDWAFSYHLEELCRKGAKELCTVK